jgi:TusA-related sulfurtransferase
MTAAEVTPRKKLDLTGVPCPANATRALMKLELMDEGELLVLVVDEGEPLENVPEALEDEGHEIIDRQPAGPATWRLTVRRSAIP